MTLLKINWKVRVQNKAFWAAFLPALLLTAQAALRLCGVDWQPDAVNDSLLGLLDAVFALLSVLGVVTDPTTAGFSDSARALGYTAPGGEA